MIVRELTYGAFERSVALPEGVDASLIQAKCLDGMLEVTMPAPVTVAPKKIDIQVDGPERKAIRAA